MMSGIQDSGMVTNHHSPGYTKCFLTCLPTELYHCKSENYRAKYKICYKSNMY